MTQLYALTGKLAELQGMADTDDEGLKEALQHAMDEIQGEFEVKADNIVMLRRNIESDVTAIDTEIERLTELKRIKSNSVDQAPAVHHHLGPGQGEGHRRQRGRGARRAHISENQHCPGQERDRRQAQGNSRAQRGCAQAHGRRRRRRTRTA